ncbi:rho GTPase activator [Cryptococcus gattii E566]|uniref:Rho GTPase activator, putative n=2 Tax=Cryptococcus gattii TaxID=37769 RepID=E6R2Q1_CRYGW|nr:Rho GTPase activator, putative [Cryptococcus gattii WM276]ADV20787.1 Rho GTPase activator, putative [Cryptococcus gattii WM276]KIR82252.1 rho GTPase activator [Cryptococcus gattii EJB2]KIY33281.1 rho GTPase activator [Cryptococcus gattii E566]KJE03607.1 rho GTPase activator [Cryptococcus gattii NT-10]
MSTPDIATAFPVTPSDPSYKELPERPPLSRPLSEISANELRRRSNRSSVHSAPKKDKGSRPGSEVREKEDMQQTGGMAAGKRVSSGVALPQTITVNLSEYAKPQPSPSTASATGSVARPASMSSLGPVIAPSSSTSIKQAPELPKRQSYGRTVSGASLKLSKIEQPDESSGDRHEKHQSAVLMAQRSSLRPTSVASYAEVAKLSPTSGPEPHSLSPSAIIPPKPPTKSKPSWLKRSAAGAGLRAKTKSPPSNDEDSQGSTTKPLPPILPPRKGKSKSRITDSASMADLRSHSSETDRTSSMAPPDRSSYAFVASSASNPPPLPPRDTTGSNIKGRIAAWTAAAQSSKVQGGPVFSREMIKRPAEGGGGKVFGREIVDAGKEWGVVDAGFEVPGQSEWEMKRRKCLPAVVIRSCDYLHIWGPKEEGIFRISGQSSHVAALKRLFDSGADIDLTECHPRDLDPHAVAGLFKLYLRELPSPLLTHALVPKFEKAIGKKEEAAKRSSVVDSVGDEEFDALLRQLPQAHWFLLAEIIHLLDLIPKHADINRMTLNALTLSLGPSLNIPGVVISELLERRETLFKDPPPPSTIDTAHDLISFSDIDIPPVVSPSAKSSIFSTIDSPYSHKADDSTAVQDGSTKRKPPKLPSRPSITKLFTSSHVSLPRQKSVDTLASVPDTAPPRVDVAVSPTSPLPNFQSRSKTQSPDTTPTREGASKPGPLVATYSSVASAPPSVPIATASSPGSMEPAEEVHYPIGTVEERARLFSTPTPIADRFISNQSFFPSLRASGNSTGSSATMRSASASLILPSGASRPGSASSATSVTNPASVIRRGPPVFFQSAGVERDRHAPGHVRMSAIPSGVESASVTSGGAGTKRKDEMINEDGEDGRGKRLSAGPGVLDGLMRGEAIA